MRYRATAAQPEREFWVAKWVVPQDTPVGIIRYTVTATDKYGRTRRVQAFRGSGVPTDDRGVRVLVPQCFFEERSVTVAALVSLAAAGCQRAAPQQPVAQGAAPAAKQIAAALKTLTLTHPGAAKVVVGTVDQATAEGLPPRRKVELLWQTVKGGWVVEDYYHFRGKKFTETSTSLGQARPVRTAGSPRTSPFQKTTAAFTR